MNSKNSGYLKSMKLDADERGYNLKSVFIRPIRVHPRLISFALAISNYCKIILKTSF